MCGPGLTTSRHPLRDALRRLELNITSAATRAAAAAALVALPHEGEEQEKEMYIQKNRKAKRAKG